MDSITQGILGAAAAQGLMGRRLPRRAGLIGAVGGVIPDLDVFIQSAADPTVGWLFHRHFTHSLFFIPIGGLIAALPFLFLKEFRGHRRNVVLAATIGYATHAPLDMLTSYGTQLFWPFSNTRVALDWIGIIDPIYTIALLIGVLLAARRKDPRPARAALVLTTLYICFGGWQHHRAVDLQRQLAELRGHEIRHARTMPAPGWLVYWRSTYISGGRLYADGIKTPWAGETLVLEGGSADAITLDDLPDRARDNPRTRRQFEIFHWFADGLISPIENEPYSYGDMRITTAVESLVPLWGLEVDAGTGRAARWTPSATAPRDFRGIVRGLLFGDRRYKELPDLRAANN
ncbi:MAG: metal-dependent hydrolase [Acidobacteriota bacterium]|nr:MAG: metal-dependent hydrolase [Acidobacteriota bacterium]